MSKNKTEITEQIGAKKSTSSSTVPGLKKDGAIEAMASAPAFSA